jgi:predicted nucleotidyltransferase
MIDIQALLRALHDGGVESIVVGGMAARAHGSARLTQDLDIVYARTPTNMERLAAALASHAPYPRGAPPGLPFRWDADTLKRGLNFTLTTRLGDLDLLGEITGGGTYATLLPDSRSLNVFGLECRFLGLTRLIRAKRDAGRAKDFEVIAELEALLAEGGGQD